MNQANAEIRLRAAGCVAAAEEAAALAAAARDVGHLESMVRRRASGEPIAWILGRAEFCGLTVPVAPGVFVPRWQSQTVAEVAASRLTGDGTAADLCCGSGVVALVLAARCPGAAVLAADNDALAVACARANGVDARLGDLYDPLPPAAAGTVDVVTAVAPYVPTAHLDRMAGTREPRGALDGGEDGLDTLRRIVAGAPRWLRPGGSVVVEIGGPQVGALEAVLAAHGFVEPATFRDPDGDVCGMAARSR